MKRGEQQKEEDNKIDTFQRRSRRNILGIKWNKGNLISNDELYKITNQTQWPKIVAYRGLRFFGHIARLDEKAPAKVALYEAITAVKRLQGKPILSEF